MGQVYTYSRGPLHQMGDSSPIPNKEMQTVAKALLDRVIFIYRCPEEIDSDQEMSLHPSCGLNL